MSPRWVLLMSSEWRTLMCNATPILFVFSLAPCPQYTEEIRQQFENIDITLSTITLLSPEAENQLRSFSSKAQSFDSAAVTQQVSATLVLFLSFKSLISYVSNIKQDKKLQHKHVQQKYTQQKQNMHIHIHIHTHTYPSTQTQLLY